MKLGPQMLLIALNRSRRKDTTCKIRILDNAPHPAARPLQEIDRRKQPVEEAHSEQTNQPEITNNFGELLESISNHPYHWQKKWFVFIFCKLKGITASHPLKFITPSRAPRDRTDPGPLYWAGPIPLLHGAWTGALGQERFSKSLSQTFWQGWC